MINAMFYAEDPLQAPAHFAPVNITPSRYTVLGVVHDEKLRKRKVRVPLSYDYSWKKGDLHGRAQGANHSKSQRLRYVPLLTVSIYHQHKCHWHVLPTFDIRATCYVLRKPFSGSDGVSTLI